MKDEKIIELYNLRNETAIAESNAKYGTYCFTVAENILHNRQDSEECVNDTWHHAWNAIPPAMPSVLKLFFAKITRNLAFNKRRADMSAKRGGGDLPAVLHELEGCIGESGIDAHIEAAALTDAINSFLSELDIKEKSVFLRRYFFVDSTAAIAKRYGLTRANVNTILSRTRKKLRDHLTKEGFSV